MGKYDDIINLTRPISKNHTPMPLENRAAQFMPFAALTGYDDEVSEAGRFVVEKAELTEEKKEEINKKLLEIMDSLNNDAEVRTILTYFVPDLLKTGGEYVTRSVLITKIDTDRRCLILNDKSIIHIDDIAAIET